MTEETEAKPGANGAVENPEDAGNTLIIDRGAEPSNGSVTQEVEDPESAPPEGAPEDGEPAADPADQEPAFVREMRAEIQDLRDQLKTRAEKSAEEVPPAPQKPPTPEEWRDIEKAWGFHRSKDEGTGEEIINIDPRRLVETFAQRMGYLRDQIYAEIDKRIHGNTSEIRFESTLANLEKGKYPDIRQFSDAIKKYLNSRYHPSAQSNPEFVEDGYFWAKGKGLKNVVKNLQNARERNMRIVKPSGGPGAPAPKPTGRLSPQSMTAEQKELAKATFRGMPEAKAYEEYCRLF
jgi:hypothetical protein